MSSVVNHLETKGVPNQVNNLEGEPPPAAESDAPTSKWKDIFYTICGVLLLIFAAFLRLGMKLLRRKFNKEQRSG